MLRVLGLVAATAIVLAACGGAASPASVATSSAPAATVAPSPSAAPVAIDVQGFKFVPATLEIPVGTTVTWTNKDTAAHTATSGKPDAKDGKFDGALDPSGGSFAFKFTTAGTYDYFCAKHPKTMLATIVVK